MTDDLDRFDPERRGVDRLERSLITARRPRIGQESGNHTTDDAGTVS